MFSRAFVSYIAALWSPAGKGLSSWLLLVMFIVFFVTFPCGILGQVWYLIVSYPDLCRLSYFKQNVFQYISNTSFSTFAIFFFEEIEPMCVIHNISIATDGDIIQFGDDVNIYPVYLSREIIIWGNCQNWLEKTTVSDYIFVNFL